MYLLNKKLYDFSETAIKSNPLAANLSLSNTTILLVVLIPMVKETVKILFRVLKQLQAEVNILPVFGQILMQPTLLKTAYPIRLMLQKLYKN